METQLASEVSTDKERIAAAIGEFRALDFWARAAIRDGWNEVPEAVIKRGRGVVFTHYGEHHSAFNRETGMLTRAIHVKHFNADTVPIAAVFKKHGLVFALDSDTSEILLLPQSERP